MPILTLVSITCEKITPYGGPIELRSSTGSGNWGPQSMVMGEVINFAALPPDQQPSPIDFFNPVEIQLWQVFDDGSPFEAGDVDITPVDTRSSYSFNYFGGIYTLRYAISVNIVEVILFYIARSTVLIVNLILNLFRLTISTFFTTTQLLIAPFSRLFSRTVKTLRPRSSEDLKANPQDNEQLVQR